jgi:hypothetical protein
MELQIVNNEIAIQLKELGFDWCCMHFYQNDILINVAEIFDYEKNIINTYNSILRNFEYAAPTQSLIIKWFREIHNISIIISPNRNNHYYKICKTDNPIIIYGSGDGYNYEQAEEAGIIEAIKLVKEQNAKTNNTD